MPAWNASKSKRRPGLALLASGVLFPMNAIFPSSNSFGRQRPW
jgi:hypothetical protein